MPSKHRIGKTVVNFGWKIFSLLFDINLIRGQMQINVHNDLHLRFCSCLALIILLWPYLALCLWKVASTWKVVEFLGGSCGQIPFVMESAERMHVHVSATHFEMEGALDA
jgi:hypothetical protein